MSELKELAKSVDAENADKKLKDISDLPKEDREKILMVGKDANFRSIKEQIEKDSDDDKVDGQFLASLDGKQYSEFTKDAFGKWLDVATMIADQRRSQLFWQSRGMATGRGKTSKNHFAKNLGSKRKSRRKKSKASRQKNR